MYVLVNKSINLNLGEFIFSLDVGLLSENVGIKYVWLAAGPTLLKTHEIHANPHLLRARQHKKPSNIIAKFTRIH